MKHEFTGGNGGEIAWALIGAGRVGRRSTVRVNPTHPGPSLSLDRVYPDDQIAPDTWRVPVGFFIDVETGAVTDREGRVWAHEDLVEL
jgi:hypothetical protein